MIHFLFCFRFTLLGDIISGHKGVVNEKKI